MDTELDKSPLDNSETIQYLQLIKLSCKHQNIKSDCPVLVDKPLD